MAKAKKELVKPVESEEPVEPEEKEEDSRNKDPRYVVGLQHRTDFSCYKDVFETEDYKEAKAKSDEIFAEEGRSTIIFDRSKFGGIIDKNEILREKVAEKPVPPPKQFRKSKKKKEAEEVAVEPPKVETKKKKEVAVEPPKVETPKKVTKNAYFE